MCTSSPVSDCLDDAEFVLGLSMIGYTFFFNNVFRFLFLSSFKLSRSFLGSFKYSELEDDKWSEEMEDSLLLVMLSLLLGDVFDCSVC